MAPTTLSPETKQYIQALQYHPLVKQGLQIPTSVTESDLSTGFSKWRESTSTSPSGRHLGHYRSIILPRPNNTPLSILTSLINIPIHTTIIPDRWTNTVTVCLEKLPGQPKTNKIRIIHLYEADLNYLLKLFWGCYLIYLAEDLNAYPDSQYGSRPGRSSIDAVTVKFLAFEYTKTTKSSMCMMDNDATACYDRIISLAASLACQCIGMATPLEHLHNEILLRNRYHVKTAYGISDEFYHHTNELPLQGQGQGSGNAPSSWNAVSSPMWTSLRSLHAADFLTTTPDGSITTASQGIAFADDATLIINSPLETPDIQDNNDLITEFSDMVQTWERLLHTTGGEINASKSHFYAMLFSYTGITPRLLHRSELHIPIELINSTTTTSHSLTHKDINQAERTLGVRLCPTGKATAEFQWLQHKIDSLRKLIDCNHLREKEIHAAYNFYYLPSITYSFPITTFSLSDCERLQQRITTSFLLAFGFIRSFP